MQKKAIHIKGGGLKIIRASGKDDETHLIDDDYRLGTHN